MSVGVNEVPANALLTCTALIAPTEPDEQIKYLPATDWVSQTKKPKHCCHGLQPNQPLERTPPRFALRRRSTAR